MNRISSAIKKHVIRIGRIVKYAGKPKVFGIGQNKTGTTSLKAAMNELGYSVGNQREAELLVHEWAERDFNKLIRYCRTAEFFQDVPFSYPYTFIVMDQAFPGSKFILTVRDNPEQWYDSMVRFHSKKFGKNGRLPTKEDLQEATYISKGRPWEMKLFRGITPENDPYNKEILINDYIRHNNTVNDYFRHRPDDLLILNVAEKGAFQKLASFLGKSSERTTFPWKNRSRDLKKNRESANNDTK